MYFQLEAENYAMRLASVIYNSVQAPLKFDSLVLRFSHPVRPPKLTALHLFHSQCHAHTLCSVGHNRRGRYSPITVCSKGTEQEHDFSTSESKSSSTQSHANINKINKSHTSTSVDSPEKQVDEHESFSSSIKTVAFCVCTAVAFGLGVGLKEGVGKASEFFAGYILEQSLSVDNLFVFVLVFKYFKVPVMYQKRVLSYGIAGAVIFRLALILLGTATLQRFEVVNLLLAAILLFSSLKLFSSEDDDSDLSDNFIVKTCQRFIPVSTYYDGNRFFTNQDGIWKATPLLLTVAVIELSDIAFAVDSIPAVFGVSRDPFIVFTSNLFAILGLRSLYTLISEGMADLEYLQPSIAVVLGFIGCKMILDFFGFHVSTEASLGFVATSLSAGVLLSLMKKSD